MENVDFAALYKELNYPSATKFRDALAKRGIPARLKDLQDFVKPEGVRQVFAPGPKYEGRIVSPSVDQRWAADLISYVASPAKTARGFFRYILIAQDIFTRKIWTRALISVSDAAGAMEEIFRVSGRQPAEMNTDIGP